MNCIHFYKYVQLRKTTFTPTCLKLVNPLCEIWLGSFQDIKTNKQNNNQPTNKTHQNQNQKHHLFCFSTHQANVPMQFYLRMKNQHLLVPQEMYVPHTRPSRSFQILYLNCQTGTSRRSLRPNSHIGTHKAAAEAQYLKRTSASFQQMAQPAWAQNKFS